MNKDAEIQSRQLKPVASREEPAGGGKAVATVEEYIAGFAPDVRTRLEKVRAAIRKAAPQATEGIGYRYPPTNWKAP